MVYINLENMHFKDKKEVLSLIEYLSFTVYPFTLEIFDTLMNIQYKRENILSNSKEALTIKFHEEQKHTELTK